MNANIHLEHRAGSSQGKHEGESSLGLCDRLDRTHDNSQRQLPTDHDYAVPTREYQTDQSSLKTAPTAARSVFGKRKRKPPKQTHIPRPVDTVTPYQHALDKTSTGFGVAVRRRNALFLNSRQHYVLFSSHLPLTPCQKKRTYGHSRWPNYALFWRCYVLFLSRREKLSIIWPNGQNTLDLNR
jgi:hypothetical protein